MHSLLMPLPSPASAAAVVVKEFDNPARPGTILRAVEVNAHPNDAYGDGKWVSRIIYQSLVW